MHFDLSGRLFDGTRRGSVCEYETAPVPGFYEARARVVEIDGARGPDPTFAELSATLENLHERLVDLRSERPQAGRIVRSARIRDTPRG